VEHSIWLSLMRDRLEILRRLLSDHGSLWITIDDNEAHYLKVLCDEIYGRTNFVATCVWEKDKGGRGDADISLSHDNILVLSKDRTIWSNSRNLLPRTEVQLGRFKNPDDDPRGAWRQGDDGTAKSGTEKQRFSVTLPSGRVVTPPSGRYWAFSPETLAQARAEGRAYFGSDGDRLPIIKRYLSEAREGVAPRTWWSADEVGTNQQAKRDHLNKLLPTLSRLPLLNQKVLFRGFFISHLILETGSSTRSLAPVRQVLSPTRWGAVGSWWSWVSIATRISSRV
jgi:adenine-specific DNA-methyltransferase